MTHQATPTTQKIQSILRAAGLQAARHGRNRRDGVQVFKQTDRSLFGAVVVECAGCELETDYQRAFDVVRAAGFEVRWAHEIGSSCGCFQVGIVAQLDFTPAGTMARKIEALTEFWQAPGGKFNDSTARNFCRAAIWTIELAHKGAKSPNPVHVSTVATVSAKIGALSDSELQKVIPIFSNILGKLKIWTAPTA